MRLVVAASVVIFLAGATVGLVTNALGAPAGVSVGLAFLTGVALGTVLIKPERP